MINQNLKNIINEILSKIIELEEQLKELKQAHYEETFKNGLPF